MLCFFLFGKLASAQDEGVLDRYIKEAISSNLVLKQEILQYEQSLQALSKAKALFMPSVGVRASYSLAEGGRTINVPFGDLMNPVYSTLNDLTGSSNFTAIQNEEIQFLPNRFHETKVQVVQPIFNSNIWYGYKVQERIAMSQDAQKRSYETELRSMVKDAYFSYLQAMDAIDIYERSLEVLDEQVRVSQHFVDAQMITKDAVYNAQLEKSKTETQLTDARRNMKLTKAHFNFLLNRELYAEIVLDPRFTDEFTTDALIPPGMQDLEVMALQQRNELKQMQQAGKAAQYLVEQSGASRVLPSMSVIGDIGYQGFHYTFSNDQQFFMVMFSLQWDLFKGGARNADYQSAVIQQHILETQEEQLKKQIEFQVIQAYEESRTAFINLSSAEQGLKTARNAYEITSARFNQNQVLPLEYQQSQLNYTRAQLNQSIAKYNLLKSINQIEKAVNGF